MRLVKDKKTSAQTRNLMRGLIAALLVSVFPCLTAASELNGETRVLLRYDDFTKVSSFPLEQKLFRELERMKVPLLVGVVPFVKEPYPPEDGTAQLGPANLGQEKIEFLRSLAGKQAVEIALHGYNHRSNATVDGAKSEFVGMTLARQQQWLAFGKAGLERAFGQQVRTFIPPYNTFDGNTVRAMEQVGFTILSAGGSYRQQSTRLAFVPGSAYPQGLRGAIERAQRDASASKFIVVVMHNYDFVEDEEPIPSFRKGGNKTNVERVIGDVKWALSQPGVKFISLDDELQAASDLSVDRADANADLRRSLVVQHAMLPSQLAAPIPDGFLVSRADAKRVKWRIEGSAISIQILLALAIFMLSRAANCRPRMATHRKAQHIVLGATASLILVLGYINGFYLLKISCLTIIAAWVLGTIPSSRSGPVPVAA